MAVVDMVVGEEDMIQVMGVAKVVVVDMDEVCVDPSHI